MRLPGSACSYLQTVVAWQLAQEMKQSTYSRCVLQLTSVTGLRARSYGLQGPRHGFRQSCKPWGRHRSSHHRPGGSPRSRRGLCAGVEGSRGYGNALPPPNFELVVVQHDIVEVLLRSLCILARLHACSIVRMLTGEVVQSCHCHRHAS